MGGSAGATQFEMARQRGTSRRSQGQHLAGGYLASSGSRGPFGSAGLVHDEGSASKEHTDGPWLSFASGRTPSLAMMSRYVSMAGVGVRFSVGSSLMLMVHSPNREL